MDPRGRLRRLLATSLCVALAGLTVGCAATPSSPPPSAPSGEPIAIGFLGELTGPFAIWGVPARNGMRLAVADVNARGGVLGRPLELVERDTQGVPDEGVAALRGLIERSGVVAAGGLVSSDVALATARVAEQERVPLFLVKAGSHRILTADSRHTFRTCLPAAPMNLDPIVEFLKAEGLTRVGVLIADYEWGRAIETAVADRLSRLDGIELHVEVAPVGEREFTAYLRRFATFDPDIVIGTGHPPGVLPFARQADELGIDAYVVGSNSPAASVMETAGQAAIDRYVDFSCADYEDAGYHELAGRYWQEFGGIMEDDAVSGYGQVLMVAEAIEAIGEPDPARIADHLRATTFDLPGYAWELGWTEWGELAGARPSLVVLRRRPPPEGVNPGADWYPEVVLRPDPLDPYRP